MQQVDSASFAVGTADGNISPSGTRHFPELQSVRGIAAVVVLLYHCLIYYSVGPTFHGWTETILNAHAAVVMFFVLSGFVLTGALRSKPLSLSSYARYCIRRAARIYPALWVAVLVALAYLYFGRLLPAPSDRSAWILRYDTYGVGISDIVGSLLGARDMLVPPFWSIKVELIASLTIPILAWLSVRRRAGLWPLIAVAIAFGMVSMVAGLNAMYLVDFAFGAIAMACVGAGTQRFGSRQGYLLLAVALAGLIFFRDARSAWSFDADYHAPIPALIEGMASALFLFTLLSSEMSGAVLLAPLLVWIGDISYSIYLLHFPIMEFSARLLGMLPGLAGRTPDVRAFMLAGMTLLIVVPLAQLSYRWIELPGIELGKKILAFIAGRATQALGPRPTLGDNRYM